MLALIVCDRPDEADFLGIISQRAGLQVSQQNDLDRAVDSWPQQPGDLIIVALRGTSPPKLVARVREVADAPLIVVAATPDEDTLIATYEAGADLVVSRPYSARLLLVQASALLKRSQGTRIFDLPTLMWGSLVLDPERRTIQTPNLPAQPLTQLEFRLCHALMMAHGRTLSTNTIVERVWGYSGEGNTELVRGLVRRLRAKIEPQPKAPEYLLTVPGIGYRLSE